MTKSLAYTLRTQRASITANGNDLQTELEHSRGWANANPELAFKSLSDFCDKHDGCAILVDTTRDGFVTYCAFRAELQVK